MGNDANNISRLYAKCFSHHDLLSLDDTRVTCRKAGGGLLSLRGLVIYVALTTLRSWHSCPSFLITGPGSVHSPTDKREQELL